MTRALAAALIAALAFAGWQSWRLERERSDRATERADMLAAVAARQMAAAAKMTQLRDDLRAAQAENAIPNGDGCGLDVERVRLLPSP